MVDRTDRHIHVVAPALLEPPLLLPVSVIRGGRLAQLVAGRPPDMKRHHVEEPGPSRRFPPERGEKGLCRRLQLLFVLPQPVGGERAHLRVGDDPRPTGNLEAPDAGHRIEVVQHVLIPHHPDGREKQRLLPEEPGAVEDVGVAVDEDLHQPRDLEPVHRGGEDHPVRGMHLLFEEGRIVLDGAVLLPPVKTGVAPAALLQADVLEHDVLPVNRCALLEDLADPLRRTVGICLPGAAHDDQDL